MPNPLASVAGTRQGTGPAVNNAPVAAAIPFIRASMEHREPAGIDVTRTMTANDQDLGVFEVPAYGYIRSLLVLVQATGGAGTSVTAAEDGPFNALKNISLGEPNGSVLSQFNSGYDCYLANKWGGYTTPEGADPKGSPIYSAPAAATGNFQFLLRIPVEISARDGLGALPNQNSGATFKVRLTLAGSTQVYGTVPTTLPNVRIRVYAEEWDQPEVSTAGVANQITPPGLNTTQFWSTQIYNVNAGNQTIRLNRVGNYLRDLIFIYRATTRAAGETNMPDPFSLFLDTRPVDTLEFNTWRDSEYRRTGFGRNGIANDAPGGLDSGVRVYDFMHEFDQALGRETRDLWLPTLGSTRLEVQGSFGAAGTLTVLTNDVAVAGNVFM